MWQSEAHLTFYNLHTGAAVLGLTYNWSLVAVAISHTPMG